MTVSEFKQTFSQPQPPASLSAVLRGLWFDGKGDWHRAHEEVQDLEGPHGAWIHAYLHRKEGDLSNAQYWYRRAQKSMPSVSLETEWQSLVEHFLSA